MPTSFRTYGSYSGFLVKGTAAIGRPPISGSHMTWVFYLLSKLESAHWGTVQNYDGCGISAGPLHAIAVMPKTMNQGPLWALINTMFEHCPPNEVSDLDDLRNLMTHMGWEVTPAGIVLRGTGKLVDGAVLRTELSGPNGVVPASGPVASRAQYVANIFSAAFSSSFTYRAQRIYTEKWLLDGHFAMEAQAYAKYSSTPVKAKDVSNLLAYATDIHIGPVLDFGMAVYHAFSVNAPAPAADELRKALSEPHVDAFVTKLIRGLGTRKYGRWSDTTDNTSRYDKTRIAATTLGQDGGRWTPELIQTLMPVNL